MSLDVALVKLQPAEVFDFNITHNLTPMAEAAGLYKAMWRPEELGIKLAGDLIPILAQGLLLLEDHPEKFIALNPENGWGDYEGFFRCVRRYLAACKDHPDAEIRVCR